MSYGQMRLTLDRRRRVENQTVWALSVYRAIFLQICERRQVKFLLGGIVTAIGVGKLRNERPGIVAQRVKDDAVDKNRDNLCCNSAATRPAITGSVQYKWQDDANSIRHRDSGDVR